MAYSKSFFGLRRGSTKSLTFSQLNGKQVTKDRVSVINNPRTSKQMYQRAIFATVATSAKGMKFIINHSFENIKEGNDSIREFNKLNLKMLRNYVASTGNNAAASVGAKLQPAGYPWVTPNPWIMSKGSLPGLSLFASVVSGEYISVRLSAFSVSDAFDIRTDTVADVLKTLGIGAHDQITLCALNAGTLDTLYYESKSEAAGCQCNENVFIVRRVVMNVSEEELSKKAILALSGTPSDNAQYVFNNWVDKDKSDESFVKLLFNLDVDEDSDENHRYIARDLVPVESDQTKAACIIRSRQVNGKWQVSNEKMVVCMPDEDYNYGLVPADAITTYTASANVGHNNNPFLDEGGNGGNNEDFHV